MGLGLLATLAIVAVYAVVLYRGHGLATVTALTAAVLAGLYGIGAFGATGGVIAAALFVPAALLFNFRPLRRAVLTRPVFNLFRRILPDMSPTEREALEAGETWWEAELFRGRPDWTKLRDFQYTGLTDEERRFLENETETLCGMLDEWAVHFERRDLPPEVWDYIRRSGFFAMLIDKEHGGLGFSALAQSAVVSKVASRSITAAVTVMVPNSLGPGELLQRYGTPEQQSYWLPRLARGEEIPCFGLTGPEVGSDASAIPDRGVVCRREIDGESVLGISLTFDKRYITLAPVATVIGLAFRLEDPDGLLGDPEKTDYGITCGLVPRDTPGVEAGRRHYPGGAFMNGPVRGEDVFVPLDAVIGGVEMAGKGWPMVVECLSAGRGISMPALATASGKGMYGATGAYSAIRRQFNLPIGRFEGVQEPLARIGGLAYTLEACRTLTASAVDRCTPAVVTAMMKYHTTEMMRRVITDAMDIHGGRGIIMGPRNYLAIPWQLLPVAITVEGANIMTRSLMIFGQGAIRCHPYMYEEMESAKSGDLAAFDRLLWGHLGYTLNRGVRTLALGLTGGRLARAPRDVALPGYYRRLERLSAALAFTSDVAMMTLGGELKLRESTSARLGDVLSQLYIASAVLKQYETRGRGSAEHEEHARWALDHALAEAGRAYDAFFRNFPRPLIGRILRRMAFPFGQPHHGPSDGQNARIAELMMRFNDVSSEFAGDIYVGGAEDPTGRLMTAFAKLTEIRAFYEPFLKAVSRGELAGETLEERLEDARRRELLTAEQAEEIRAYEELRRDVIDTDEFPPEYLRDPSAAAREETSRRDVDLRHAAS